MNFNFLDDLFSGIGNGLADTDKFVKREMPFDSGWGAPAAVLAAIAAPQIIPALAESGAGAASVGAAEGTGAAAGGGGMNSLLSGLGLESGSFGGELFQLGGSAGAEGSIGSGGMNSLLSSFGLDTGSFAGQEAFQLPMQSYTPEYLNMLAQSQGVDAGDVSFLDRLLGNTEQGLYKQEGLAKQASGQTMQNMLKKQAQQKALSQLSDQFLRPQVRVPLKHRQSFMSTDHADLNGVKSFFKQTSDSFMAQIVKPQVLKHSLRATSHCLLNCNQECRPDAAGLGGK
jgi:hypothetical protein